MSGLRLLVGLPMAALVTFGIFMMMNGLISSDAKIAEVRPIEKLVFNAKVPPPEGPKPFESYKESKIKPPPVISRNVNYNEGDRPIFTTDPVTINPGEVDVQYKGSGAVSLPILRIEPVFPSRCASRGLEGSVLVEFDLTPDGAVVNPRILSSVNRCFNRAAMDAVRKWKYSPSGQRVKNVRTSLTFQLAD